MSGAPAKSRGRGRLLIAAAGALLITLTGCESGSPSDPRPDPEPPPESISIPARGTGPTLDVATWNLLHFGSQGLGPTDEELQLQHIRDVILGTDADIWGVQEVRSRTAFFELWSQLPGYAGLLANDTFVIGGTTHYGPNDLTVGIIYKQSVVNVGNVPRARVILTDLAYEFAGRPPMLVEVELTMGGTTRNAVIIVLHAKANAEVASWERRAVAAAGLKEYLDANWPDHIVLIPGDWNDDIDESIASGRDTPYRPFVDAAPDWVFPTAALSAAGVTSILGYDDVIDHILASDEAMALYEEGSAIVYRVDEYIPDYEDTTSDHLPVLVRFRPPGV